MLLSFHSVALIVPLRRGLIFTLASLASLVVLAKAISLALVPCMAFIMSNQWTWVIGLSSTLLAVSTNGGVLAISLGMITGIALIVVVAALVLRIASVVTIAIDIAIASSAAIVLRWHIRIVVVQHIHVDLNIGKRFIRKLHVGFIKLGLPLHRHGIIKNSLQLMLIRSGVGRSIE